MAQSIKLASIGVLAGVISLLLSVGPSWAQSAAPDAEAGNPAYSGKAAATSPESIDDATLQHAARAFVKVTQIVDKQKRMMNSEGDDSTKAKAAAQAENDKLAAVKSEGLQPQQYNQVLQVVQNDKTLQQKFMSYASTSGTSSSETGM